jgi:hypothetical protein
MTAEVFPDFMRQFGLSDEVEIATPLAWRQRYLLRALRAR